MFQKYIEREKNPQTRVSQPNAGELIEISGNACTNIGIVIDVKSSQYTYQRSDREWDLVDGYLVKIFFDDMSVCPFVLRKPLTWWRFITR